MHYRVVHRDPVFVQPHTLPFSLREYGNTTPKPQTFAAFCTWRGQRGLGGNEVDCGVGATPEQLALGPAFNVIVGL